MTKLVRVSQETYNLLHNHVPTGKMLNPFEAKVMEDGQVEFPLDDYTWGRLQQYREPGESDDQFFRRLLVTYNPKRAV